MKMSGILPFARELLQKTVETGDIAIDGTAGNGHDTLFLTTLVGKNGYIYSFDVQQKAIDATKERLVKHHAPPCVSLIHDGHEKIGDYLKKEHKGNISGAIFNLGYLPGSDKSIVTKAHTTIKAINTILLELKKEGILVLVIYHGHQEGKIEKEQLLKYVQSLPQEGYHVLKYAFINQKNDPPFIIAIEKR